MRTLARWVGELLTSERPSTLMVCTRALGMGVVAIACFVAARTAMPSHGFEVDWLWRALAFWAVVLVIRATWELYARDAGLAAGAFVASSAAALALATWANVDRAPHLANRALLFVGAAVAAGAFACWRAVLCDRRERAERDALSAPEER